MKLIKLLLSKQLRKEVELEVREETIEMRETLARDTMEGEHDYHKGIEERGIELARLEAKKEHLEALNEVPILEQKLKDYEWQYNTTRELYRKENERLGGIVEALIGKMPTIELKDLNVNVDNSSSK